MNVDQIRKTSIYETALDCAKHGESVHDTLMLLLERSHIKTQINNSHGETLVVLSMIVEQAYKDEHYYKFEEAFNYAIKNYNEAFKRLKDK